MNNKELKMVEKLFECRMIYKDGNGCTLQIDERSYLSVSIENNILTAGNGDYGIADQLRISLSDPDLIEKVRSYLRQVV